MTRRAGLLRSGGLVSVPAWPGQQPGGHGLGPAACGLAGGAGCLGGLHSAVCPGPDPVRIWRAQRRRLGSLRRGARFEGHGRGSGGPGCVGHVPILVPRPPACGRGHRRGLDGVAAAITVHPGSGVGVGVGRFDRVAGAVTAASAGGTASGLRCESHHRGGLVDAVRIAVGRLASRGSVVRRLSLVGFVELLPGVRAGVRGRPCGLAHAASQCRAGEMGGQ